MQRSSLHPQILILATICVVALAVSSALSERSAGMTRTYNLSNWKFISLGGVIVKLDTRTGAMYRLRGEPNATQTGNTWALRVPAVKNAHSGMLDIRQFREDSANGVFLADVNGERVWLLKWRGNEVGEWFEVKNMNY